MEFMQDLKLYMVLLGCRPKGRHTEQHDIFFTIGRSLSDLVPAIHDFWPEVKVNIHIDAWREVKQVDGYDITIIPRLEKPGQDHALYFLNLGGYKKDEFEEHHYKVLTIASSLDEAKVNARQTAFYKHTGFTGAVSHIDDKYGIDTDDIHEVKDILPPHVKEQFCIHLSPATGIYQDEVHLGYLPLYKIPK
jgi:hypothetical protein